MPRTVEVTDAEVIAAGREIERSGEAVTAYTLRKATKRGNPERMLRVWNTHKAASAEPSPAAEAPALPPAARDEIVALVRSLGDGIALAVRRIAADLAAEASAQTQAERDLLAREREKLVSLQSDALEAYTSLAEQADELEVERTTLVEKLHQAQVARDAADLLRQHEADRCATAEAGRIAALAEAARAGERATLAEQRVAELSAELATVRRAEADAATGLAVLRARLADRQEPEIGASLRPEVGAVEPVVARPRHGRAVRGRRGAPKASLRVRRDLADTGIASPSGLEAAPSAGDPVEAVP